MSSVEAAASLFGSSDSDSDLDFLTAPEGTNSSSDSPASAPTGLGAGASNELFAGQDSSGLFDVKEGAVPSPTLFDTQGEAGNDSYHHGETDTTQAEAYHPDNSYGYGQDGHSYPITNGQSHSGYAEGWYDQHGQWHAYEQEGASATIGHAGNDAPYNPTGAYGNAGHINACDTYSTSSQYNFQAGQAGNSSSSYGYQAACVSPSSSAQSTYDPYRPTSIPVGQQQTNVYEQKAATTAHDPYRPSTFSLQEASGTSYTSVPTNSYDPYRPATSDNRSQLGVRSSSIPHSNTFVAGESLIPPPSMVDTSKPPASPYRPSTANAYDPPIPVVKPRKSFTASALHYQSSPYAPHSATSPTPPPLTARKVSSPPQSNSSLVSPPPPARSSLHAAPTTSAVSYAQPSFRSSSPYDPPAPAQYGPPKPHSHGSDTYPGPQQINGQYTSPATLSPPTTHFSTNQQQMTNKPGSVVARQELDVMQYPASLHHVDAAPYVFHETTAPAAADDELVHEEGLIHSGESSYSPSSNLAYSETTVSRVTSRPGSSHSSVNSSVSPVGPRRAGQSPASERRSRMSPDGAAQSGGSQRAISPASDSARSQGSLGRSSPVYNRAGTSLIGQSFSVLDEQTSKHDEPHSFFKRTSLDTADSPSAHLVGSLGNYAAPPAPLSPSPCLNHDRDAVELTNGSSAANVRTTSPVQQNQSLEPAVHSPYDPYRPNPSGSDGQKFSTDAYASPPQPGSEHYEPVNQYAPQQSGYGAPETRERSMSNLSSFSSSYDPYAPSVQAIKQQDHSPHAPNNHAFSPPAPSFGSFGSGVGRTSLESSHSSPPISGPYAPSPSLLGTNDPLGRANAKVPVVSFGFGGKFVTCFHSPPTLDTGFDVALSSRKCTDIHIRSLHKAIPESVLNVSTATYPGPLFGDPGSPVTTLVRAAGSTNAKSKTKKAKVLAYLAERAEELERGLGYLTAESVGKRRAEGKLSLVRLLRALVEHDGQLCGSSTAESAARAALLPRIANPRDASEVIAFWNAPTAVSLTKGTFGSTGNTEKPLAEYAVHRSVLETIQEFLLRGEKRKAYHYALDERLWAHAMVISSSIDKEAFKEVVTEFVRTELGVKTESRSDGSVTNGLESLRLAYSLYSGQSSSAVQHLLPIKSLQAGPSLTLQPPSPMNLMTPLSPNFPSPSQATGVSPEILSQWPEHAVMLFSGQMGAESSSALTTLGDYLISNDWVEAAHCCYLLSPQSSPIGGVGSPSVRIVLVGSHSPNRNASFFTDPDAFIFSEILEFALSLHPPPKGQEAFSGFPHLQVYRLIRAFQLAEMGYINTAKRYCEAITATPLRPSPYLSQLFSDQLKELYNRLNGDPLLDKSNSWIGGKLAKPSLDGFGDWLGGTLTKFVAGETDISSPSAREHSSTNNPAYAGAFSRYSNISSTNNSRGSSPVPSFTNNSVPPSMLPGRTDSAAGFRSVPTYSPSNRASPAFDYERPESTKSVPPARALISESSTGYSHEVLRNGSAVHGEHSQSQSGSGWWTAAYGNDNGPTPTASSFTNVDAQTSETDSGGSGFISLMDNYSPYTPSPSATTFTKKTEETDDFDDDLGLGNNASEKKKGQKAHENEDDDKTEKEEPKKEDPKKPETNSSISSSSSWFGRWFSRPSSAKPAPVKANLGEETSFYYNKELKRWVNKKAGAEPPKQAAPPPPPSRAQTVSPSRASHLASFGPPPPSPMPPPGRPVSAMDASSSGPPRKTLTPLRSSLIPEEGRSSASSTPPTPSAMSSLSAAPPMGRPKSAAKKHVRSRYVDVFQQPS
ncbi:hypothetical protein ACEPAF_5102 [Sanghuangporus sanghuang]